MKFGKAYSVLFLLFYLFTFKVLAQSNWQLVIVPQANLNSQQSVIAPQVYQDITSALSTQLVNDDFTVFDQSLLNLNNCIKQACEVISDNKLLNLAQAYNYQAKQLAINLAIVYQIEIFDETISKVKGVRFNFSSYLVDLDSGERVESYSDSKRYSDLAIDCEDDCFTRWQAKKAYQLAQDAGYILALKINRLPKRYRYEMEFSRFNSSELTVVTNFLNAISDKKMHIALSDFTIKGANSHDENNKYLTITASQHASELNQLLQNEFERHSLSVLIDYRSSVNKFTIVKRTNPIPWPVLIFLLFSIFLAAFCYYTIARFNKKTIIKKVKQAIEVKDYYLAYSMIDKSLLNNKLIKSMKTDELVLLRNKLDEKINPIQGNVVADKALAGTYFFTGTKVDLCQKKEGEDQSSIQESKLALGYQYLEKNTNQCQLIYKNSLFYIVDNGSKHSCQYNDVKLLKGRLAKVETCCTLFVANDIPQALQACQLKLDLSRYTSSALIMSLNPSPLQFLDPQALNLAWPDHQLDLNHTWVMLGESLALGVTEQDSVDIGCINGCDVLAYLSYDSGYYIEPAKNKTVHLKVNNQDVLAKVPLEKRALISLNGHEFRLMN